jgi:hypothetical protein
LVADVLVLWTGIRPDRNARRYMTEPRVVFIVLFTIYFGVACYLALVANWIYGDAWSRVEIAQRILFSRDPHLAAIGFVWSPLPVLALLPIVALNSLWPQLTALGLAGGIVSAMSMAGATVQLRGLLSDAGLGRVTVLLLTAAFAFHPLVLYFGANGMSEAMLLLFLLTATRYFAMWLRDASLNSLITTGIALALAYLSRYEALAAAFGAITVVAIVSLVRARKQTSQLWPVLCDVAIVAAPVTLAFFVWTLASWLITGQPFDQFTSVYGNTSEIALNPTVPSGDLIRSMIIQAAILEPFLPVLLLLLLGKAHRPALIPTLASLACLGATLSFLILGILNGSVKHELRFLIELVPLAVVLAAACVTANMARGRSASRAARTFSTACVLSTLLALPVSAVAMLNPAVNEGSGLNFQIVFSSTANAGLGGHQRWAAERRIAVDLDRLHLPSGVVLVDDFLGFPIVATSSNPKQFVITSDRDFQSVLTDPRGTGVQYVLVPQPSYFGNLDAVNRQYAEFFANGGGFASLVREYPKQGYYDTTWRLYRIN